MNGYRGLRPAALTAARPGGHAQRAPARAGDQGCLGAGSAAQAARAARNRIYVRMLLRERYPEFAAALNVAVRDLCADLEAGR